MISSRETPTRMARMIKADADITLAIHHLKSKLQFLMDCRHIYGHQDGKKKKKQRKREQDLAEERRGFVHETEAEISESKAKTAMANMFQLGGTKSPRRP